MITQKTLSSAIYLFVASVFALGQTTYAQCRDPWINNAYREVAGRAPMGQGEACECNIKLYNNGSWNNYNELKSYVQEVRKNVSIGCKQAPGGRYIMAIRGNTRTLLSVDGGGLTAVAMLNAAGNFLASGWMNVWNMVAAGGGNLIGNDSAGMVAAGGGNLIGNDGSTINLDKNTPGFLITGGGYQTLSGRKIKTSGNGGIKIQ